MHASRSKSRAKRSKAPVNPWRSLPRLATLFDAQTPQAFFKGSSIPDLEELTLTESQLLEQTAALLGVSLAQLVRAGTIVYAKREFLNSKHHSQAQDQADNSLPRAGSGIAGVADARVQAAYDALREANNPITPAKLAIRAKTAFQTALRWLKIHHPELLLQKKEKKELPPDKRSKPTQETPLPATTDQQPPSTNVIPFVPKKESPASMQPLEVVVFRELSLPGSHTIALAFGARDSKGLLYFSAQPFPHALMRPSGWFLMAKHFPTAPLSFSIRTSTWSRSTGSSPKYQPSSFLSSNASETG